MKYILIIIFLMSGICSQGQKTAQQLSSLRAQDVIINKSIADLNAAIVKLLAIVAEQDAKIKTMGATPIYMRDNNWFKDSIQPVKDDFMKRLGAVGDMMPASLTLYVDTTTGLRTIKDTLYFKK